MRYSVIAALLSAGAVHDTVALDSPAVADTSVGASGALELMLIQAVPCDPASKPARASTYLVPSTRGVENIASVA